MSIALAVITFSLAPVFSALADPLVGWSTDCDTTDGWHWNNEDANMNAKVAQDETSTIKITQDGNDTWGKVAYVVEGIDLEKTPILEVKANKVELNSAFSVAVAPSDWSELITVVKRTSADGIHKGNIERAVKDSKNPDLWKSPAKFNVVVIIEGKDKSTVFDWFKIRADK